MTTPQARRRREVAIIVGIAVTLILVIVSSVQNQRRDHAERVRNDAAVAAQAKAFQKCITTVVHDLTTSLDARAKLTDPRAKSIQTLIADLLAAGNSRAKGEAAIVKYQNEQKHLSKETAKNPIPPFPTGKCASVLPAPTKMGKS